MQLQTRLLPCQLPCPATLPCTRSYNILLSERAIASMEAAGITDADLAGFDVPPLNIMLHHK